MRPDRIRCRVLLTLIDILASTAVHNTLARAAADEIEPTQLAIEDFLSPTFPASLCPLGTRLRESFCKSMPGRQRAFYVRCRPITTDGRLRWGVRHPKVDGKCPEGFICDYEYQPAPSAGAQRLQRRVQCILNKRLRQRYRLEPVPAVSRSDNVAKEAEFRNDIPESVPEAMADSSSVLKA